MNSMPKWYHTLEPPKVERITAEHSIYNKYNPYGFMFNVNHPVVAEAMKQFRQEIGEVLHPISDADRHEFEKRIACGYYPELNKYIGRSA